MRSAWKPWPLASWKPLADLVGKLRREERYHLMHIGTWLERLASNDGEARDRLVAALDTLGPDAGTVFTPLGAEGSLVEAGVLARPMADLERDWRARLADTFEPLGLPLAPATMDPWLGRTAHGDAFRWLWGEFTSVRPERSSGHMVIGTDASERMSAPSSTTAAGSRVPVLSVVDLGIVHRVTVRPGRDRCRRSSRRSSAVRRLT